MNADRAAAVAASLDLDVAETPICYACLSLVSAPLHEGDTRAARRKARRMAPAIWNEGLDEPALAALEAAASRGVDGAYAALRDAKASGGRSAVAREIVLLLAAQMAERSRGPVDPEATAQWAGTGWTRF